LFDLDGSLGIPGIFSLRLLYSNIIKLEETFDGILDQPTVDVFRGEIGNPVHRGRASLTWNSGCLRFRWRAIYTGAAVDGNERAQFFEQKGIEDPLFLEFGDEWVHNVHIQYQLNEAQDITLFAGINNVFNNLGPFLPQGTVSGGANNFASEYGSIGRFVYGGVRLKF
jgi:outer membrane receptor protein involved in Fe transport